MWPQILASDPGSAPCMFEGPSPVHRARDSLPQSWGAEGHHGYMPPPSWGPQRGRLAIRSDTKTSSSQRLKLLPPPAPGEEGHTAWSPPRVRPGVLRPSQTSCRRWEEQSFSMSSGSRAGPGGGGPDPKSGQGFLSCRLPTSVTRSHGPSTLSRGKKEPGRFVKSSEQLQGKKGARQACLPGSQEPVLGLTSQHPAH